MCYINFLNILRFLNFLLHTCTRIQIDVFIYLYMCIYLCVRILRKMGKWGKFVYHFIIHFILDYD